MFFQLVGAAFVLIGVYFAISAIETYEPDQGYCEPKSVYYVAAIFAPISFACFVGFDWIGLDWIGLDWIGLD